MLVANRQGTAIKGMEQSVVEFYKSCCCYYTRKDEASSFLISFESGSIAGRLF